MHFEVAKLLCDADANKDEATKDGAAPLFMLLTGTSELRGWFATVMQTRTRPRRTAPRHASCLSLFQIFSQSGHLEVARLVRDASADKDQTNKDGAAPFHLPLPMLSMLAFRNCEAALRR